MRLQPTHEQPYGENPADAGVIMNRDPELGQPVGKGDPAAAPILLAKMSKGQEIELTCKAYKVCFSLFFAPSSFLERCAPHGLLAVRYNDSSC
jgi:hypothetical protein